MATTFKAGDRVSAKVRGHPHWPARVTGAVDKKRGNTKYYVYYHGTAEIDICTVDNLCNYGPFKEMYGKPMKKKDFNEALAQIEDVAPLPQPIGRTEQPSEGHNDTNETGHLDIEEAAGMFEERALKKSVKRKADGMKRDTPKKKRSRRGKGVPRDTLAHGDLTSPDGGSSSTKKHAVVNQSGRYSKQMIAGEDFEGGVPNPDGTALESTENSAEQRDSGEPRGMKGFWTNCSVM